MSRLFDVANVIDSDDWYTPRWIFDGLGLEFDLDVAAPDDPSLTNVTARRFVTVAEDGLAIEWHGQVWCNPPYSRPIRWCQKWATHEPGGCILLRSDLSTRGPFVAYTAAHAIYVPRKRIQFDAPSDRRTRTGTNFTSVLFGRGDVAVEALHRLASATGGTTRTLK